mgnify:CR=1 FL=1
MATQAWAKTEGESRTIEAGGVSPPAGSRAMKHLRPFIVFGTRPEAIKLAPVVLECRRSKDGLDPIVCLTGQHRELLQQAVEHFGLTHDLYLDVMVPRQTLAEMTARCVELLDRALLRFQPDCVVAQGDTTTVMAASMAAFYRRIPFVHVEGGLRTGDLRAPWPEEFNRRVASLTAALHCASTRRAADQLLLEGVPAGRVRVTGSPVIDALHWTLARMRSYASRWEQKYGDLGDRRMVLITGHRRESFGRGFEQICGAIRRLAGDLPDVAFVYPVHPNPRVRETVHARLCDLPNVRLEPPLPYPEFVWLMQRSTLILTDSGGVEEEAPTLRKPLVVMRETTERWEVVDAGAAIVTGVCEARIVAAVRRLLADEEAYRRMQLDRNPYGDGQAAARIVQLLSRECWAADDTDGAGAPASPAGEACRRALDDAAWALPD